MIPRNIDLAYCVVILTISTLVRNVSILLLLCSFILSSLFPTLLYSISVFLFNQIHVIWYYGCPGPTARRNKPNRINFLRESACNEVNNSILFIPRIINVMMQTLKIQVYMIPDFGMVMMCSLTQ